MADKRFAFAALVAAFAVFGLQQSAMAENRALLIGIGAYANLAPEDQLSGPKNDLRLMQGLLAGSLGYRPEQIRTLADGAATKKQVIAAIRDWLVAGTTPGDRAFFYFSGHGVQVPDADGDEEDTADEALVMADVAMAGDHYENVLSDDEIRELFAGMEDRFVTVVVDACHSGTVTRSGAPAVRPAGARYLPGPVPASAPAATRELGFRQMVETDRPAAAEASSSFVSFTAAAPAQVAYEDMRLDGPERTGVFTSAFVSGIATGMADLNGNSRVSYSELLTYLRRQSNAYCDYLKTCLALTPTLEAPDLAYQFDVTPRFNTAAPETSPADFDFTPQPGQFNTAPAPVPPADKPALDNLAAYNAYQPMPTPQGANDYNDVLYDAVTETLGHLPDSAIALRTDPPQLVDGGAFVIELVSETSGQLLLFDISDKGEAYQFFPNAITRKTTGVTAGRPFRIPDDDYGFDFRATGAGGTLLALVVEQDVDLETAVPKADGFAGTMSAEAKIAKIVGALSGYVPVSNGEEMTTRPIAWSYGILPYEIYPPDRN